MMLLLNKDGEIHVHAPFSDKYLMDQFLKAIADERKRYDNERIQENKNICDRNLVNILKSKNLSITFSKTK